MVSVPDCCEKLGLRKGAWTAEEDRILKNFVLRNGHGNWRTLPRRAGLARCGKSCRFRWTNYLNPNVKRGNYSKEEEETIINLHTKLGNRWSAIAAKLPGRTDNEIKNVWHTYLKKRVLQKSSVSSTAEDSKGPSAKTPTFTPNNLTEISHKISNSNVLDVIHCENKVGSILESPGYKSSQEESDGDFSNSIGSNIWYLEENHNLHVYDLSNNFIVPELHDTFWSEGLVIMELDQHEMPHAQDIHHEDDLWTHDNYSNFGIDIWS